MSWTTLVQSRQAPGDFMEDNDEMHPDAELHVHSHLRTGLFPQ